MRASLKSLQLSKLRHPSHNAKQHRLVTYSWLSSSHAFVSLYPQHQALLRRQDLQQLVLKLDMAVQKEKGPASARDLRERHTGLHLHVIPASSLAQAEGPATTGRNAGHGCPIDSTTGE